MRPKRALPLIVCAALAVGAAPLATAAPVTAVPALVDEPTLDHLGSFTLEGGETAAEIAAYSAEAESVYVINGAEQRLEIWPLSVTNGGLDTEVEPLTISLADIGVDGFEFGDVTSVDVNNRLGIVGVNVQGAGIDDPGYAVFLNLEGEILTTVEIGPQPDMGTFSPDGTSFISAGEGEPRDGYSSVDGASPDEDPVDPMGTVSVIDVTGIPAGKSPDAAVLDFTAFDDRREELVADNVLLQKGIAPSRDLEPEYVAVNPDSTRAYVSLQEANAIATVDLGSPEITSVDALGFADHSEHPLDLNSEDEQARLDTYENLYGVYMPDAISVVTVDGTDHIVTANEGDAREWPDGEEENPNFFLNEDTGTIDGLTYMEEGVEADVEFDILDTSLIDGFPDPEAQYMYGARSAAVFAIDERGLERVGETGSDFETVTAERLPDQFNATHDELGIDGRSDSKGPEPEGVAILEGKTPYAFVGLERIGGVMVLDLSDPSNPLTIDYVNTRDFSRDVAGDSGPEGIEVVPAADSPTSRPLVLVANEISGTLAVFGFDAPDGADH